MFSQTAESLKLRKQEMCGRRARLRPNHFFEHIGDEERNRYDLEPDCPEAEHVGPVSGPKVDVPGLMLMTALTAGVAGSLVLERLARRRPEALPAAATSPAA
jgi:hypothetical protein